MAAYQILMHELAYRKASGYLQELQDGKIEAGAFLRANLDGLDLGRLDTVAFIGQLLNSKRPRIFAESEVAGDGRDWNQQELSILGDVAIAVPVIVFDNGLHDRPVVHEAPFKATLIYVPGALLRSDRGHKPADWDEVTGNGAIKPAAYEGLYERRLLPALFYANARARAMNAQALITVPGLGCGAFAGPFRGELGVRLGEALASILKRHSRYLEHVRAVYYDPYHEGNNARMEFGHLSFLVRPLARGNEHRPQLCRPVDYEEDGDDFADCHLFSIVAWDHVSWPGNDFYTGARATDDGVKAAATSSMAAMTGVEGRYDKKRFQYEPPAGYRIWSEAVRDRQCRLRVEDNLELLVRARQEHILKGIREG